MSRRTKFDISTNLNRTLRKIRQRSGVCEMPSYRKDELNECWERLRRVDLVTLEKELLAIMRALPPLGPR